MRQTQRSHFLQRLFNWLHRLPPKQKSVLLLTIYTLGGVALEEVASVFETAEKVTPWDPSSSLHFVLLLRFGLRYTPALILIPLADNLLFNPSEVSLPYLLVICLCIIVGYGTASALLLNQLHIDPYLRRFHDVLWFAVIAAFLAPLAVSACVVTLLAADNLYSWSTWGSRFLQDWAGEATGIVMLAPPLLLLLGKAPGFKSRLTSNKLLPQINLRLPKCEDALDWGVEVVALLAISWAAYSIPADASLDYTYFIFLPIIWIAIRHGFERTVLAVLILNISAAFFVYTKFNNDNPLALQFGLMTVSHTGLLLGAFVTERQQSQQQLFYNAYHDSLTGLYNRAWLMDKLKQAIARANQEDYLFAILFIDLDRFKVVNDSLGHALGDQMLLKIGDRLKICLRHKDTVARFGGDEFTILLDDIQGVREATRVAERIIQELAKSINLDEHEIFTTASIGIAISYPDYQQPEDILRDADIAMYRAKAQCNRYAVFDKAMHDEVVQASQLETDLRRAVESLDVEPQFQLYYQPIVSLSSSKISGFEALIRWQHPTRGLLAPGQFIATAEETGLIVPMGNWVLHEACRQLQAWQVTFGSSLAIAVNVSVKQFLQPDLVEQIAQVLTETPLNAASLKLEITESLVIENAEAALAMLAQIKALGVQLAIDDFGLGYSSLSRLHSFRVNTLKIDRSFVSQIGSEGENSEIVSAIILLAHNLGINVTAEGVETAAQLTGLRKLNCEEGQGYLFARPLTSQAAALLLSAAPRS